MTTRNPLRKAASALGAAVLALSLASTPAHAAEVTVDRVAGNDRYETSALASRSAFTPGVDTVFVASGEGFADALTAGAAAGFNKYPLLLTRKASLPMSVEAELKRLAPKQIVVIGGENAVGESVADSLRALNPHVSRVAGATRYHTAVMISQRYFANTKSSDAYVVSGQSYPDALVASSVGARMGAPVLLTERDQLPAVTEAEVDRLNARRLLVIGGPSSVSEATAREVFQYEMVYAYRIAGVDRYETAANVARDLFQPSHRLFLASGENYADALAGVPAAAAHDAHVLIVPRTAPSTRLCRTVQTLQAKHLTILGGTQAVSDAAADALAECAGRPGVSFDDPRPPVVPDPVIPGPGDPRPSQPPASDVPVASGTTPPSGPITCSMFKTQPQAQAYYNYWLEKGYGDHFNLAEGTGVACRQLPQA